MARRHLLPALIFTGIALVQGCSPQTRLATTNFHPLDQEICHDEAAGIMWQRNESGPIATLDEAERYVKGLRLGGFNDWRLPTRNELYNLTYLIDLRLQGACPFNQEGQYWSREKSGEARVGAWEITATQCDPAREYYRGKVGRVRAVRP